MEPISICVTLAVLLVAGPLVFKLLGAILRGLGPLIAIAVGLAIALGVVWLAVNMVGSVISTAFNLLFGPLGLLILGGAAAYFGYRQWKKRQYGPAGRGVHTWDAKPKRNAPTIEIGDDGEIVTLDELLDEDAPKKKRQ